MQVDIDIDINYCILLQNREGEGHRARFKKSAVQLKGSQPTKQAFITSINVNIYESMYSVAKISVSMFNIVNIFDHMYSIVNILYLCIQLQINMIQFFVVVNISYSMFSIFVLRYMYMIPCIQI